VLETFYPCHAVKVLDELSELKRRSKLSELSIAGSRNLLSQLTGEPEAETKAQILEQLLEQVSILRETYVTIYTYFLTNMCKFFYKFVKN
jgi:hypothetical protein